MVLFPERTGQDIEPFSFMSWVHTILKSAGSEMYQRSTIVEILSFISVCS